MKAECWEEIDGCVSVDLPAEGWLRLSVVWTAAKYAAAALLLIVSLGLLLMLPE